MGARKPAASRPKQPLHPVMPLLVYFPVPCALVWAINHFLFPTDMPLLVLAGPLFFIGAIGMTVEAVKQRSDHAAMRARFPGFAGERLPLFHLLAYAGPDGERRFDEPDLVYSLGVADDAVFVIANKRENSKPIDELLGGRLVPAPGGREPLGFLRRSLRNAEAIVRTDADIAAGAQDTRDYGDRLAEFVSNKLTSALSLGTSTTTIVPYAAYVVIRAEAPGGERQLLAAVPTNVPASTMRWLAVHAVDNYEVVDDAIGSARDEVEGALTDAVGLTDAVDVVNEARAWTQPGAAIATTDGARGRLAARLVARRIRALAPAARVRAPAMVAA